MARIMSSGKIHKPYWLHALWGIGKFRGTEIRKFWKLSLQKIVRKEVGTIQEYIIY